MKCTITITMLLSLVAYDSSCMQEKWTVINTVEDTEKFSGKVVAYQTSDEFLGANQFKGGQTNSRTRWAYIPTKSDDDNAMKRRRFIPCLEGVVNVFPSELYFTTDTLPCDFYLRLATALEKSNIRQACQISCAKFDAQYQSAILEKILLESSKGNAPIEKEDASWQVGHALGHNIGLTLPFVLAALAKK